MRGLGAPAGRHLIVSAQICPLVPILARQCGFAVRFVDVGAALPVPSATQLSTAIDENTAGVIIAPMYGFLAGDYTPLVDRLRQMPHTRLILDLAQGLGLNEPLAILRPAADAVVYSFGLGKGLDCGGGLLLTRSPLPRPKQRRRTSFAPLIQSLGVRTCSALGIYRLLAGSLDSAVEKDKQSESLGDARASSSLFCLWQSRLATFLDEVRLARARSLQLAELGSLQTTFRNTEDYLGGPGTHLRQILRLRDPAERDRMINRLRAAGIDAAPAGEPLPGDYFPDVMNADFPHAAAFRQDALRLPFLGRLSERQFAFLGRQLEICIASHLSA